MSYDALYEKLRVAEGRANAALQCVGDATRAVNRIELKLRKILQLHKEEYASVGEETHICNAILNFWVELNSCIRLCEDWRGSPVPGGPV